MLRQMRVPTNPMNATEAINVVTLNQGARLLPAPSIASNPNANEPKACVAAASVCFESSSIIANTNEASAARLTRAARDEALIVTMLEQASVGSGGRPRVNRRGNWRRSDYPHDASPILRTPP